MTTHDQVGENQRIEIPRTTYSKSLAIEIGLDLEQRWWYGLEAVLLNSFEEETVLCLFPSTLGNRRG